MQCVGDLDCVAPTKFFICSQINTDLFDSDGKNLYKKCLDCVGGDVNGDGTIDAGETEEQAGVWTAVGCIKREPVSIVQSLVALGLGGGGGIALLSLLGAGFIYSTSGGDPKRVSQAKDLIVASLTGLLFIIFSVTLLEYIGYSVFRIPGFGGT